MKVIKKSGLPKRTQYTSTDIAKLERKVDAVRSQGCAVDREESLTGAFCIAAPLQRRGGGGYQHLDPSKRRPNHSAKRRYPLESLA
jgi:DNA-binding IclR family transcriptional regulator